MAINATYNRYTGLGGRARHLHHAGVTQIRRILKGVVFARHGIVVKSSKQISAEENSDMSKGTGVPAPFMSAVLPQAVKSGTFARAAMAA